MCGIIGIVGKNAVVDRLVDGLRRMEYRGYDSAARCTIHDGDLVRRPAQYKLANLVAELGRRPAPGEIGIAHTRWATHGAPTKDNAHPQATDHVALVHNGIIDNFKELRDELRAAVRHFISETASEAVAHLVSRVVQGGASQEDVVKTVRLRGAFALAFAFRSLPDMLISARRGSPLVLGYGEDEMFLGSDALALAPLTQRIAYLEEGDWVVVRRDHVEIFDAKNAAGEREITASGASAASVSAAPIASHENANQWPRCDRQEQQVPSSSKRRGSGAQRARRRRCCPGGRICAPGSGCCART